MHGSVRWGTTGKPTVTDPTIHNLVRGYCVKLHRIASFFRQGEPSRSSTAITCLSDPNPRINQLASEAVVVAFGGSQAQHHNCVACGTHQVVTFFDNLPIFAVIKPKLFPPILQVLKHLEASGLHSRQHVHESSFNT